MKPKLLSWNMRMLNEKEKKMWIKGLIRPGIGRQILYVYRKLIPKFGVKYCMSGGILLMHA
jgi:hypothetical protein